MHVGRGRDRLKQYDSWSHAGFKSPPVHYKTEERRESCMNTVAIMLIDSLGACFSGKTLRKRYSYDPQVPHVVFNSLHPE